MAKKTIKMKKSTAKLVILLGVALVIGFFLGQQYSAGIITSSHLEMTVITSKSCDTCDTTRTIEITKRLFNGIKVKELEYETPQGKKLVEDLDIKLLPAYVFNKAVEEEDNFTNIRNALKKKGNYYYIIPQAVGSFYDPTKESECADGKDDDGDSLIDCDDPDCSASLECREEVPKKLDLFVMSMCPFGTMAENAMKEVLNAFGSDMKFELHFIADDNGDGTFRSLHGQKEVDEDIRQSCIIKYYPETYMNYIWCVNKDYTNAANIWEDCAKNVSMDVNKIKSCFEGDEGKELLRERINLTNELGIGASPTWLANNRFKFSGLDPTTIQKNFCQHNQGLSGCDKKLSQSRGGSGGQC
ncbi:MAG: hypothetical protein J7K31_00070 [Candidatus Aenigmarchaeota archaeon]|nr:hypothetical protein [Candidatus Aenigmarchaeota archaeon]